MEAAKAGFARVQEEAAAIAAAAKLEPGYAERQLQWEQAMRRHREHRPGR